MIIYLGRVEAYPAVSSVRRRVFRRKKEALVWLKEERKKWATQDKLPKFFTSSVEKYKTKGNLVECLDVVASLSSLSVPQSPSNLEKFKLVPWIKDSLFEFVSSKVFEQVDFSRHWRGRKAV